MGLLQKKLKKDTPSPEKERKHVDIFPYMLDGTFIKTVEVYEVDIEYIPLTLAEIQEIPVDDDGEEWVARAIAKALRKQLDDGLRLTEEVLIFDTSRSCYWNAKETLKHLTKNTRQSVITVIQTSENATLNNLLSLFNKYHEEYMGSDLDGVKRTPSPLDDFLNIGYTLNKTPYKFNDISSMTPLQYYLFTRAKSEIDVRAANDHAHHSKKHKPSSAPSKPSKKYVGA